MMYYVKMNNRILGPFAPERLQEMLEQGKLHEDDHLSPDKENWRQISEMKAALDSHEPEKTQSAVVAKPSSRETNDAVAKKPSLTMKTQVRSGQPQTDNSRPREKLNVRTDVPRGNQIVGIPRFAAPPEKKDDAEIDSRRVPIRTSCISVLWNPLEALPAVYDERDGFEVMVAGLALALLSAALVFVAVFDWALLFDGEIQGSFDFFSNIARLTAGPIFMLFASNAIVRILCSTKNQGGFDGDLLIAGAAALPVGLGVCACSLLGRFVNIQTFTMHEIGHWLLAIAFGGILLYCAICFLFIMLAGIARIDEIEERMCVLVVAWTILMATLFTLGAIRLTIAAKTFLMDGLN